MTKEQYERAMHEAKARQRRELDALKDAHDVELRALALEYAKATRVAKIGDIIKCRVYGFYVMIEQVQYLAGGWGVPEAVYVGTQLKKDGTQPKKKTTVKVLNSNAIAISNVSDLANTP